MDEAISAYLGELTQQLAEAERQNVDLKGRQLTLDMPKKYLGWLDPMKAMELAEQGSVVPSANYCREAGNPAVPVRNVREQLLMIRRGVLLGEPGSGKTWTLARLALDYAIQYQEKHLIPILVPLKNFNGVQGKEGQGKLSFIDFIAQCADVLAPLVPQLLRENRLVLLCDALNEMPRTAPKPHQRDLVAEVRETLETIPHFVLTCRVRDYQNDLGELRPLEQIYLRELTPPQIRELVMRRLGELGDKLWGEMGGSKDLIGFWTKVVDKGEGERFWAADRGVLSYTSGEEDTVWHKMHEQPSRLIALCQNPFMAARLCDIYETTQTLPKSRGDLFEQLVKKLLLRESMTARQRGEQFPDPGEIQQALVAVAEALQAAKRTVLARADALNVMSVKNKEALLTAAVSASILNEDNGVERNLTFSHQLLQEYFAVQVLLKALEQKENAAAFFGKTWWDAGVWRETAVILGEVLGGKLGANEAARWLAPATPELALDVILRNGGEFTIEDVEPATCEMLIASATARTKDKNPRGRVSVGRVLGMFDADQRPEVTEVDRMPFCWVPPGRFWMGSEEYSDEQPTDWYEGLAYGYWMGKFPVTNAQFATFVQEGGYTQPQWWTIAQTAGYWNKSGIKVLQDSEPRIGPYNHSYPFNLPNHPVVGVSWFEALAYAEWLTERWRKANYLREGWRVVLPSEPEREKAARGGNR